MGDYFIEDHNVWITAYRNAFSFRSSHYFISYLSESIMIMAGFNNYNGDDANRWEYTITKPMDIELPRSLTAVVVSWNIPMHRFLKFCELIL